MSAQGALRQEELLLQRAQPLRARDAHPPAVDLLVPVGCELVLLAAGASVVPWTVQIRAGRTVPSTAGRRRPGGRAAWSGRPRRPGRRPPRRRGRTRAGGRGPGRRWGAGRRTACRGARWPGA